jgi:hypothetical protein
VSTHELHQERRGRFRPLQSAQQALCDGALPSASAAQDEVLQDVRGGGAQGAGEAAQATRAEGGRGLRSDPLWLGGASAEQCVGGCSCTQKRVSGDHARIAACREYLVEW